jgi:hypothetical protein
MPSEWTIDELRGGVATKEQLDALEKLFNSLKERVDRGDSAVAGRKQGWGAATGVAAFVILLAGFFFVRQL